MTRFAIVMAAFGTLGLSSVAWAQDEGPWEGKVSLGYLSSTGNSENLSVNASAEVAYTSGNWQHIATATAIGAQEDKETTSESYMATWKSEYNLSEDSYVYGRLRWHKDKFSGYDQQITETFGYGRRLLQTDTQLLKAEVGIGLRQSDLRDGTAEDETILRGALDYEWQFSETAEFSQDVNVESGSENTFIESVSAVKAKLVGDLALALTYTVHHNTEVPAGSEKTDTFTAISLEYSF